MSAPGTTLAADGAPVAIDGLAAAAAQLTELLERETALVRAMRIDEIAPLQEAKRRLTLSFQDALRALGPAGERQAALPAQEKARWLAAGQRLAEAAIENERALRVGTAATERLIASIVAAVRERQPATAGYTARSAPPRHAAVSGVALDRRL